MNVLASLLTVALALNALSAEANAASTALASSAVNGFGLAAYRMLPAEGNICISPYSFQSALLMTHAGAAGKTREEMAKTLHYHDASDEQIHASFGALAAGIRDALLVSEKASADRRRSGGRLEPITFNSANRLFGQDSFAFRPPFLALMKDSFRAPMELLDFQKSPARATQRINAWVEEQTKQRIRNLIPEGGLTMETRLVLVNALYMKAPWQDEFSTYATKPVLFKIGTGGKVTVPTMSNSLTAPFRKANGFTSVALPYSGGGLQFLIVLPDPGTPLKTVETALTAEEIGALGKADRRLVEVHLPKFKLEPPTLAAGPLLRKLGMWTAFDIPVGSADFDRMAPRLPDRYLFLSEVYHKTFIAVDEKGTEAAAATAVAALAGDVMPEPEKPVVVRVDRPFLFAIQHGESGACIFLGRVMDPR
jgi:serpin B